MVSYQPLLKGSVVDSCDHKSNMYIEANKEASLPDKNQYNSIKSSENHKQISWKTVSEFKEKINKLKNDFITSKKDDSIDEANFERKKRKLNYTNCWEEDLTNHGYARCLRSRCNFISNNIRIVKSHYKDCIGVPRFKEPHFCSTCQNYLYSSEAHAEHVPICKGFNKYNQRDYKYEKGLRPRKIVSKVPLERFMSWKTQILHEGLACCGYKMCTFVSMSLSDLEEHYITCCGVGGVRSRCCACRKFKFSTEDEYAQHKARCPAYTRLYHSNLETSHGYRRQNKVPEKNVTEIRWKKPIVQPKPEVEPGVWRQQRACTQQDIRSWKRILSTDKCVRCSLPKCNFIAMSLEDMIRHFSYCNEDENFAKVVCPYCKGRVTSQDVLKKHIERTHSSSNGIPSKVNQETTVHVSDDGRNRFLENDQMERVRRWQMQFIQFGHAYCPELNCNFVARTLRDLHLHVLICKEIARKRFTTCRKCETELTTEQLVEHRCHEDKSKSLDESEKLRCETSPVERERRDFKTYSRKRKVDLDLNNEYCGNLERSESGLSNKVVEWNVIKERRSQVEVWKDKNEVEVLREEVERVERRRTSSDFDCSDIEVLELDLETTVVEFGSESDKSEIEIIEERLEKAETEGSDERKLKRNEIEMIQAELEGIETVDLDDEKDEMLEDEEVEKVETVEAVDVGLESEDEEPEKVETIEDKLKKLLEDDKPKTVEVDEREEEEEEELVSITSITVDSKKDEAEKPEDKKEDTPEAVILEDSKDDEREESKKDWNERKEDESEKDDKEEEVDSFGLDESEEEEEELRMEIDEGVMSTIFETLDDDFDKFNPPYSIVGNEIEVFEGNENSQETVIVLPNDDSQSFLINEDTGTLDRSEPASTDSEQASENEEAEDNEGVDDNGQGEESQGVEQSGEQNDDTSSDDSSDNDSGKESDNGRDERKKKDDEEEDDGDGKKSENRKEVDKTEDSDNAEEGEEKDSDDDEEIGKKIEDRETKESNKRREEEEGSSKVRTKTEEPKEGRKTRRSGKIEGSEMEKDKAKESRKSLRRSKKWSEDDGNEEYIPKGPSREGSGDESETIVKPRGRRGRPRLNNEVSIAKPMESQEEKTGEQLKCGKCDFKGNRNKFDQHNWTKHSGLGWVDGEKEVDLNDVEEITRLVRTAFKVTKRGVCEVCKEVKRSYLGFVSHVQKCGKSPTEMDALKVQCPHCSTKCLKYCLKSHIYIFHSGREVDKAKSKNKGDTGAEDADAGGDVSKDLSKDEYEEKVKVDEDKESDNTTQESVVSSSKRKSALRAASKFQEAFKDNTEQAEEDDEKAREPGYFFYEKGGKLPKLCYQLVNLWYALKRKKKVIPCRHQDCNIVSIDVKEAKLHHFTCSHFPSEVYLCELCDYYSVSESEVKSHVKSNHRRSKKRGKGSKEDADTDFADKEVVEVEEEDWEDEEEEEDEEEDEESENDFEECDSVFERQNKKKKNRRKGEEYARRMGRKRMDSDSDEDTTELVHKQNFCEREKLENLRGDEFYSNALEMTREFEESYDRDDGESSQTEDDDEEEEEEEEEEKEEVKKEVAEEEEVNSEIDHSGVWPQLHTKSEDWCRVSPDVSSAHLPEILESISVSFLKGDKTELNWRRFKRFEGDLIEDVPALFVGGSVRSLSWCKVSFRRALEKSVRQYLAVSTSKNIDHLTDIHKDREPYSWSLVQIWDCGALENSSPVEPPKFCLGLFQEGGEIWDMLWFPEDTYGRGSNGKLIRIGVLATAADDGAVRIWSICEPSQIAFSTRLPLFITEPLVKLIIDNFLEDSCVRLSIGRDGIIAGGYVNGCLAVWNLKNITSPFSNKIGKCIIIKPHLIIQAHRTSITALTFCPNNNRYITSGGLDRVVKLWDLESPWVPVEQYQRELCLDNIWPRNWPMNIHNFEDVYPNNRKGVVRFVKGVVSSKHSPCLILDNTCLSLSFSDWLNSICGCNNTGEVKIRFLKNFLRDQDKKHEKNQSTLSSLRLEKLIDEDDSDWESSARKDDGRTKSLPKTYGILNAQYGIVIKDHNVKDKGRPLEDAFHPEDFPIRSINKVCFNPNFKSFTHIAVGYNCGLVRILRLNELQFNHAIRSFSENAKKPRL